MEFLYPACIAIQSHVTVFIAREKGAGSTQLKKKLYTQMGAKCTGLLRLTSNWLHVKTPGQCLGQKVVICSSWLWAAGCIGCMYVLYHSKLVMLVGAKCV